MTPDLGHSRLSRRGRRLTQPMMGFIYIRKFHVCWLVARLLCCSLSLSLLSWDLDILIFGLTNGTRPDGRTPNTRRRKFQEQNLPREGNLQLVLRHLAEALGSRGVQRPIVQPYMEMMAWERGRSEGGGKRNGCSECDTYLQSTVHLHVLTRGASVFGINRRNPTWETTAVMPVFLLSCSRGKDEVRFACELCNLYLGTGILYLTAVHVHTLVAPVV